MSTEAVEAVDVDLQALVAFEEETHTVWNGREIRAINDFERSRFTSAKIPFFDIQKGRTLTQTVTKSALPLRGWNYESFPIPPTKPIFSPVPDGDTCFRYAKSFKDELLEWMSGNFVGKGLMKSNDYYQIERILQMLVDEVENYTLMVGFYNTNIDWKEVLHPLNRLWQFWNKKWELYGIPPSPYDYPLP